MATVQAIRDLKWLDKKKGDFWDAPNETAVKHMVTLKQVKVLKKEEADKLKEAEAKKAEAEAKKKAAAANKGD